MVYQTKLNTKAPEIAGLTDPGRGCWPGNTVEIKKSDYNLQVGIFGYGEYVEFREVTENKGEEDERRFHLVINYYKTGAYGYDRITGKCYRFGCQHTKVKIKRERNCIRNCICCDCGYEWVDDSSD